MHDTVCRITFAFVAVIPLLLLNRDLLHMHSTTRNEWVRERSTFWWEQIVNVTFTPRDWISNFRMSHQTFLYICNQLSSHIQRKATVMRTPISVEQRVAVTLWYLATGTDYRTISHLFGISKSSVCLIVKEVCSEIVCLASKTSKGR